MKRKRKKEKNFCVYCAEYKKTTKDHVPPESFFPKPKPSDLITVPACAGCNGSAGKDEEFFLATFMFSEAGESVAGKKLWNEKIHRMYDKNKGLRRKIAQNLKYSDVITSSGIFLGRKLTIKQEPKRFENVVSKIVKGLYFFEYNEIIPKTIGVMSHFIQSQEEASEVLKYKYELKFGTRRWDGIFEYCFNRNQENPEDFIWLLRFYGYAVFFGIGFNKNEMYATSD